MTLAELRARQEAILAELRNIDSAAGEADLDETASARFAELTAEHDANHAEITRMEAARSNRERFRSLQVKTNVEPIPARDVQTLSRAEARDSALAIMDTPEVEHLSPEARTQFQRIVRTQSSDTDGSAIARLAIATTRQEYRDAFMRYARGDAFFLPDEVRAIREVIELRTALNITTDGQGGFAVPIIIDPTVIMTAQGTPNEILARARVETITNDVWRGLSSAGVTWKFRAEATASTNGEPTIAQPTVATQRADGFIEFSVEIQGDWPNFAQIMMGLFGEGYSELLINKLTNGTVGSNEPNGVIAVLNAAASGAWVETTTAGVIGAKDVYGLWAALPIRFRGPGTAVGQTGAGRYAWMSSTGIQNSVRQLASSGGANDPNFTITIADEGIPRLFGREYPMNDYMTTSVPAGTGTQALLVVGDWNHYLVAQRVGMTVEYIPHMLDATTGLPTGQRGWFAWARVGGDVVASQAFKLLRNRSA